MNPITLADIRGPALYEGARADLRKSIIALKKHRRVCVGDMVELVFENRKTLIFQIEEMLRAEGKTEPAAIQAEIDVYNPLLPTDDSLSATLFVAVPRGANARRELDRLVGLDEHLLVRIGDHAIRATFEEGRSMADRISAVQYTRYPMTLEAKRALVTPGTPMSIEIDHPTYRHRTELSEHTRASLAGDYA